MADKHTGTKGLIRVLPSKLKRYLFEYLDTRVIFISDLVLSVLASIIVLWLISVFAGNVESYRGAFTLWWLCCSLAATVIAIFLFKNYKIVIRHAQLRDLLGIFRVSAAKVLLMCPVLAAFSIFNKTVILALLIDFLLTSFFLVGLRILMILVFDIYKSQLKERLNRQRILVYGTSEKSVAVVTRLQNSPHYQVVGLLVHHSIAAQYKIADTPV